MFIVAENNDSFVSAAEILCDELRNAVMSIPESRRANIQEIRLRCGKPLVLTDGTSALFIDSGGRVLYSLSDNAFRVTQRHIYDTFRRLCSYSVYSCANDIKNGFITVKGGHRAGLCGTAVVSGGKITAVNDISSIDLRISRQITGVSEPVIKRLCPLRSGVLIAGVPSSGKTTILRDIAYRLSLGIDCKIMRTVVIDERGEISGTYSGKAYNELGLCDIMNGYPKGEGIMQAIRAMSPQVIICDELGDEKDCRSVEQGINAGVIIIATAHASSFEELMKREHIGRLIRMGAFGNIVMLGTSDRPSHMEEIIDTERITGE